MDAAAERDKLARPSNRPWDALASMNSLSSPPVAEALARLIPNAHAPYSGVHVAAVLETPDGQRHMGVNVENAAYPQGVCAEASAISDMVTHGGKAIRRIWVASDLPGFIWPCGGCRQKIWEFAEPGCEVISVAADGSSETHTIEALLPLGFRLNASRPSAKG
jgi:cytidine deaminase